jgi:hypothetical protein
MPATVRRPRLGKIVSIALTSFNRHKPDVRCCSPSVDALAWGRLAIAFFHPRGWQSFPANSIKPKSGFRGEAFTSDIWSPDSFASLGGRAGPKRPSDEPHSLWFSGRVAMRMLNAYHSLLMGCLAAGGAEVAPHMISISMCQKG